MTGKLKVMDRTGHTTCSWSTDLEETIEAANQRFNALLAEGYTAFTMNDAAHGERITAFDPEADTIVMVPRMVGG